MACKAYFEEYLIPTINKPLTLGLDEVDKIFEYPEIYRDFFGLLRALHEEGKRREIWNKLRLVGEHPNFAKRHKTGTKNLYKLPTKLNISIYIFCICIIKLFLLEP